MKSILLTSTALVAFAGASFADGHTGVSFGGSATLGYNDNDDSSEDQHFGFYWDAALDVTLSQTLDNGLTVTGTFGVDVVEDDGLGLDLVAADWVLSVESENAGLYFGDTSTSGEEHWDGVSGDATAGFLEGGDEGDAVIRGEATFGGVTGSISYFVEDEEVDGLQVAAVADLGGFNVIGAYQAETDGSGFIGSADAVMGVSVAGAFSGVDVMGSYITDGTETSIGVSASAPVGPVVIGGYYSMNDVAADEYGLDVSYENGPFSVAAAYDQVDDGSDATWEVDANYDTGMGAIIHAGMNSGDDYYVAGTYDLGGGATLLVSYASDEDDSAEDEIGEDEVQAGTTVEVSFEF